MKATITIHMDNAAFGDEPAQELGRILAALAREIQANYTGFSTDDYEYVRDLNGNTVGKLTITDD